MRLDRIKISMEFNAGSGLWLSAECNVAPDENPIEEFKKTRQTILDAYKEMAEPRLYDVGDVLLVKLERSREDIIAAHLETINECKTLRNLEMFANMVQRENEQVLYDAFNEKKKQLQ